MRCTIPWMPRQLRLTSLAMLLAIAGGLWLARPAPIIATDQEQTRLDQAAPVPSGSATLIQTVVPGHSGFSAIDLLAVVYSDNPRSAVLTVQIMDGAGRMIVQRDFQGLAHNAPIHVDFPPQINSAGQSFQVRLSGTAGNKATVWAYDLNRYTPGGLVFNGQPLPGDLRFSTSYTYLWPDMLADTLRALGRVLAAALPLVLILWLPGALLLDVLGAGSIWLRLGGARLAAAIALSIALLALAWLWAGVVGWHWSAVGLWAAYVILAGAGLARLFWLLRQRRFSWPRPRPDSAGLALILLASVVVRLLAARDLAFPAWVDSSHHVLIARLLAAAGQVPAGYQPALPIDVFYYHFAFHALDVTFSWLTGQDLVSATLFLGQVINGLLPLSAYALAWGLTGRRRAALVAAFVVGLVSFFPGYFVTWGRYTQLTGMLLLGPAAAALWRGLRLPAAPPGSTLAWLGVKWRPVTLAGLLAAGVFLGHYRVLFFFVVFAVVALLAHLRRRQTWVVLASAGLVALVITLPWVVRLTSQAVLPLLTAPGGLAVSEAYNAFPSDYFNSPLERGWLILAAASGLWGLFRRNRGIWSILAWTAGVFASLNAGPATWLVNNNSWAISLFLPGSALLGWGAAEWWQQGKHCLARRATGAFSWTAAAGSLVLAVTVGLLAYGGLAGARTQLSVVNPSTVLATAADAEAINWVQAHVPPDAVFAINSWNWLSGLWAGSDGGAWILPVTGRQTTSPPNDYAYGSPAYVARIDDFNVRLAQSPDASSPEFRALLAGAGVTHIFIGARGGTLMPEMFVGTAGYQLLYSNGADWIFAVVKP